MIELENCPFCGKYTAVKIASALEMGDCKHAEDCNELDCTSYCVVCDYTDGGCGASSRYARTPEEAAEAWNRRAGL